MIKYPKMLNYCPLPCTNMRFIFGWPDKNDNEDTDTQTEAEDSSAGVGGVTESVGSIIAAESAPDPRCDNSDTDL